jgi:hypothetical protein
MPTNTSISTQLTDVPEVLRPYITGAGGILPTAQTLLTKGYNETYGDPLKAAGLAGSGRIAGLSPMQQQIGGELGSMRTPGQFGMGAAAAQAGLGSLGQATNAFSNIGQIGAPNLSQFQMQGPQGVNAPNINYYQASTPSNVSAQNLNTFQMAGPQQFTGENVSQYMSPYAQQVMDVQKQEALRDFGKGLTSQNLGAARQGTYGGARNILANTEAQRNLQTQLGGIQAAGMQNAFQNAQQQFNASQAQQQAAQQANLQAAIGTQQFGAGQNLQAQQLNQAAQQGTSLANLQAMLGTQQLGAGQNLQSQLANQAAQQATGQTNLQALLGVQQLGAGQSLEAQRANQAAQLQAAQGFGQLGQTYGNLGQTYGALGTAQQASDIDRIKTQGAYGDLQRATQQQQLDSQYQDLMTKLNYPITNLETMNNLVRGVPLTKTGEMGSQTTPPPSFASQLAGMGLSGLGLYNMFGGK